MGAPDYSNIPGLIKFKEYKLSKMYKNKKGSYTRFFYHDFYASSRAS